MRTNDVLYKYELLTKLILKNDNDSVESSTKIKVIKARIEYNKVYKQYQDDLREFVENNTEEHEYKEYISQRLNDEVNCNDYTFTEEEFNKIVELNYDNDVTFSSGVKLTAEEFMEVVYVAFVHD